MSRTTAWISLGRWMWVYHCFGADGECLYIGMTGSPGLNGERWRQHKRTNPELVSLTTNSRLYGPYSWKKAMYVERQHLLLNRPRFNRIPKWLENRSAEYVA